MSLSERIVLVEVVLVLSRGVAIPISTACELQVRIASVSAPGKPCQ